ncbi:hypothetical protein, partial [Burkholderia cepacia]
VCARSRAQTERKNGGGNRLRGLRGAPPSERKTRDRSNAVAGFSCFLAAEAPVFPARAGRYY